MRFRFRFSGNPDIEKARAEFKRAQKIGYPDWILNQQYFRENLKLGTVGETGPVNDLLRSTTERIGANIMGKRMLDQGERAWPEEAPFHKPVYVLTHEKREPWVRPGGTTYFINDGPERALELARESAGSRDIRIAGGADVIPQYLNLGIDQGLNKEIHRRILDSRRRRKSGGDFVQQRVWSRESWYKVTRTADPIR
jgi:dihydrofolate reductase